MKLPVRIVLPVFAALVFAGMVALAPAAEAGRTYAARGEPCQPVGARKQDRSGDWYVCEQRARTNDPCPVWHALHPQPGPWPSRKPVDCPRCPPSPSVSPSVSASPSASMKTASPSTSAPTPTTTSGPGGEDYNNHPGTLPVTGPSKHFLAFLGVALILLGGTAIAVTKPWRRHD